MSMRIFLIHCLLYEVHCARRWRPHEMDVDEKREYESKIEFGKVVIVGIKTYRNLLFELIKEILHLAWSLYESKMLKKNLSFF